MNGQNLVMDGGRSIWWRRKYQDEAVAVMLKVKVKEECKPSSQLIIKNSLIFIFCSSTNNQNKLFINSISNEWILEEFRLQLAPLL